LEKVGAKHASGGQVEAPGNLIALRFVPRASGQITRVFAAGYARLDSWIFF